MKSFGIIICFSLLLLLLCGCSSNYKDFKEPVEIYYCSNSASLQTELGAFATETRDFFGYDQNLRSFLNIYLAGPADHNLNSPFPTGAWIIDLQEDDNELNLLLNSQFSRLAPNELTLACSCLCMTIFELSDADTVNMIIDLSDTPMITMTKDNLILFDSTKME